MQFQAILNLYKKGKSIFYSFIWTKQTLILFLFVALNIFSVFAIIHSFKKAIFLLIINLGIWCYFVWTLTSLKNWSKHNIYYPIQKNLNQLPYKKYIKLFLVICLLVPVFLYVVIEAFKTYEQIVSLCGLLILILISGIFSNHPARINLWQILFGTYLQCVIALLVLKWPTGKSSLNWLMQKTISFLSFTGNGTSFVYGFVPNPPNICGMEGPFAYTSLPVITFFGALCSLLYYYGIFQWILIKMATLLYYSMGTTAAESLNAIASVFLGPTEAAVLVQSSTGTMTRSEIVTTMTAGYSMIDGSLFATYIAFGACPVYLIAANFMSAPATLVISKILHPEVQASIQKEMKTFRFPPCEESSALESLSNGAVVSIKVIAAIVANLIVYVALITMADVCIGWLGGCVGYSEISFTKIMSWIFYPFAYILGVTRNHNETMQVAKLIGLKTVLNEFYAYQQMSIMLINHQLSDRSQMIAIFALCGYSNFSQIGSQIGIFGALSPKRRKAFVKCVTRSMIGGEIACFMTACIAGAIVSEAGGCMPSDASDNCLAVDSIVY